MSRRWSPGQEGALRLARGWLLQCHSELAAGRSLTQPIFRLFGFAGVGKTSLAKELAEGCNNPMFGAFTGKAALMMARNGCAGASTIHSMIYKIDDKASKGGASAFKLNRSSPVRDAGLLILDECSMIDEQVGKDLLSFKRPILVLGDPAQLPPIKGQGYFTAQAPDVLLTEIHRQAAENPIIHLATEFRNQRRVKPGRYGESLVTERGVLSNDEVLAADQVLVGKNFTRRAYNRKMRGLLGFTDVYPEKGDRLVCLRNDRGLGLFNGGLYDVTGLRERYDDEQHKVLFVKSQDFPKRAEAEVRVRREFFTGTPEDIPWQELRGTQQFDFGYALTVHKAQGSQWDNVIAYDESSISGPDWWRWAYTAVTRAAERITLVL